MSYSDFTFKAYTLLLPSIETSLIIFLRFQVYLGILLTRCLCEAIYFS